jgi:two-component system sensor histidine kinase/response regulator
MEALPIVVPQERGAARLATWQSDEGFRDFAESIVQHVDEVFFWCDPDRLTPYFVSHSFERIWGQPCESAYADPSSWIESILPEDRDRVTREFELAGISGQAQVEYRIMRPDGDIRWIWTRLFPAWTQAGEVKRLIGIAQDCTERKQAAKAQAFLASIVESSDDSIIGTDLDGKILSWNQSAERLFGYHAEEAIGKLITLLFPKDSGDHLGVLKKIRHEERIERFDSMRIGKDGLPIDVSVILSPIKDAFGRLQGVSAIYRDISALKRADWELLKAKEAAESANTAKSEFLANMSHEIRTPMNGILGMTDVLLDSGPTAEQREYLEIVKYSAESLLTVIHDILDFSKIEAQKLNLERKEFNLKEILDATLREMAIHADMKGVALAVLVRPEIPAVVSGDSGRLRQILVNLMANAIKFTEAGEVLVTVAPSLDDSRMLHFSVRDTGIGVPPDKLNMIFDAFTQVDASSTRKFGGTGLGLTIAARLVEMMGGKIWVESDGSSGSTFHFTFCLEA